MRVGLISDLHGNCLALDAVLAELRREELDAIVCLGDVAVGPQSHAVIERIRELECPTVAGNWDVACLEGVPSATAAAEEIVNEIHRWWSDQLSAEDRAFLRTFVPTVELRLEGIDALCFHGSPRSYDDWIFATTPDEDLETMFDGNRQPLLVGGHTHLQLVRRWGRSLLVNPGSVGLPFLTSWPDRVRVAPWAEYAILSAADGRIQVDLRRTTYDAAKLLAISRASGMPHAEWWADCWRLE